MLLAQNGNFFLKTIFFDYATLIAPRDPIFGMYTQMTGRNYIGYTPLNSMVIGGH